MSLEAWCTVSHLYLRLHCQKIYLMMLFAKLYMRTFFTISQTRGQFPCLWIACPGFESRPGASPQCGMRGGRSHCNTVEIMLKPQALVGYNFFYHFPLYDETLRHIQLCNIVSSAKYSESTKTQNWSFSLQFLLIYKCEYSFITDTLDIFT